MRWKAFVDNLQYLVQISGIFLSIWNHPYSFVWWVQQTNHDCSKKTSKVCQKYWGQRIFHISNSCPQSQRSLLKKAKDEGSTGGSVIVFFCFDCRSQSSPCPSVNSRDGHKSNHSTVFHAFLWSLFKRTAQERETACFSAVFLKQ